MLASLLGQKRRVGFFAVGMALALSLLGLLPGSGIILQVVAILCATLVMAAVAVAVLVIRPQNRGWLELIAAGTFLGAILGRLTPLDGLVGLPLGIALTAGLVMVLQADWRARLPVRYTLTFRREGQVMAGAAEVFEAAVPGHGERFVSARLVEIEPDRHDATTFYAAVLAAGQEEEEATITLVASKPDEAARYHVEGENDAGEFSSVWVDVTLTAMDPMTTHVSLSETREGLHPGDALRIWFDDDLGLEHATLIKHLAPAPAEAPTAPVEPTQGVQETA